ncbi:MAG: hypothetical protein E7252_06670 [Lachnospira sp.]|nr:hypothetical protein [Lachnospira sp.]
MQLITEKIQSNLDISSLLKLKNEEFVIFDIETTGLSSKTSNIYLIGYILYTDNGFELRQFFSDSYDDESNVLEAFFKDIKDKKYIISYNGNGFDIPYINNKAEFYKLNYNLSCFTSIDLYRFVIQYKSLFKLINYKQPTVEEFLKIDRKDCLSGGELIDYYKEYLKTNDVHLLKYLLLHNHDDLTGLFDLISILKYINTFNCEFEDISITDMDTHIIINALLPYKLPSRLSFSNEFAYISISDNMLKLKTDIINDTLKHFFENYKEYVYLPAEDNAIHISVGQYVDKAYKQKACKENCYTKRNGRFIKQAQKSSQPAYGYDYSTKNVYIKLTDAFTLDKQALTEYVRNVINNIKKL